MLQFCLIYESSKSKMSDSTKPGNISIGEEAEIVV